MVHYSERWAAELQRLCGHHGITSGTAHGCTGREFKLDFFTGIAQLREIPAVADFPLTVSKEGDIEPESEAEAEEIGEALSPSWSYDASVCSVVTSTSSLLIGESFTQAIIGIHSDEADAVASNASASSLGSSFFDTGPFDGLWRLAKACSPPGDGRVIPPDWATFLQIQGQSVVIVETGARTELEIIDEVVCLEGGALRRRQIEGGDWLVRFGKSRSILIWPNEAEASHR
jgi:hypothetical protein